MSDSKPTPQGVTPPGSLGPIQLRHSGSRITGAILFLDDGHMVTIDPQAMFGELYEDAPVFHSDEIGREYDWRTMPLRPLYRAEIACHGFLLTAMSDGTAFEVPGLPPTLSPRDSTIDNLPAEIDRLVQAGWTAELLAHVIRRVYGEEA